jgi:general secretion pathway protein J
MRAAKHHGFTLIELLVALALFALLSVAAYRGLDTMLQTRDHLTIETRKWQQLDGFFSRMAQDVAQALPRTARGQNGIVQPAWLGLPVPLNDNDAPLTFTRAGIPDQSQSLLAPQRIGYRLQQGTISLLRWPFPDQAPNAAPLVYPLLTGVSDFRLQYMDANGGWMTQWPPANGKADSLPFALGVEVTLEGGEKVSRVLGLQ